MPGATIGGDASFTGSTVTGKLAADRMEVKGTLFLRDGTFTDIDLPGATIGGDADLVISTFTGLLDLSGTAIGGEFRLSSKGWMESPTWQDGATLILRNVNASALQARNGDWSFSGGNGLLPTDLKGFTYSRLGGLESLGPTGMGNASADWLIAWIEAQHYHDKTYDPQPYTQLAGVLEEAGATDKAKEIRYARFKHKLDRDTSMSKLRRVTLLIEYIFIGFGEYPFWALAWFICLVLLGGLFAQWSNDQSVRGLLGFWYSLENALPLIETNGQFQKVVHGRPWLVHFFHFQKAFGFFLATILVGALTLLSS